MIGKPSAAAAARRGFGFLRRFHSNPPGSLQSLVEIVASGVGGLQEMESSLDRLGITVTPSLVTDVINSSCNCSTSSSSSSRRLLRFFSWCRRKTSSEELGDEVSNRAIRALSEMNDLTAVGIAVSDLQKEGRKLDPKTFVCVVETLVKAGRPEEAVRLFRNIEEKKQLQWGDFKGGEWSSVTSIVHALCAKGHVRKAEGILWHHTDEGNADAKARHRSLLLHGWCVHGNAREARKVIEEMKLSGNCPSLALYNAFLRCICKRNLKFNPSGLVPEATNVMTEMRSCGVSPNTVSFNILLSCLGKTRRVKEACRVLLSMTREEKEAAPDLVSYYIVIRLLFLTGRYGRGSRILNQVVEEEEKGKLVPRPNVRFYHGLIGVLCGMEKVDYALQLFEKMKKRCFCCYQGEVGNTNIIDGNNCGPTYDLLIEKLCRNGKFDMARLLWDEAVGRGVTLQCSEDFLDPCKAPKVFDPKAKPSTDEISLGKYCKRRALVEKWKNGAIAVSRNKNKVKGKKGHAAARTNR